MAVVAYRFNSSAISGSTFSGRIGEMFVYPRLLDDNEVTLLETYLSKKWAIAIS